MGESRTEDSTKRMGRGRKRGGGKYKKGVCYSKWRVSGFAWEGGEGGRKVAFVLLLLLFLLLLLLPLFPRRGGGGGGCKARLMDRVRLRLPLPGPSLSLSPSLHFRGLSLLPRWSCFHFRRDKKYNYLACSPPLSFLPPTSHPHFPSSLSMHFCKKH